MISENCLEIGVIAKTHGFDGSVRIDLKGVKSLQLKKEEPLFLRIQQKLVPFFMGSFQKSHDSIITRFEDVNDVDEARKLCGHKVFARAGSVKTDPSSNPGILVGYKITDMEKGELGEVDDYMESAAHPLLLMKYMGAEVLIPFTESIVKKVDPAKRLITVELPEGLLSLYLNEWDNED